MIINTTQTNFRGKKFPIDSSSDNYIVAKRFNDGSKVLIIPCHKQSKEGKELYIAYVSNRKGVLVSRQADFQRIINKMNKRGPLSLPLFEHRMALCRQRLLEISAELTANADKPINISFVGTFEHLFKKMKLSTKVAIDKILRAR